MEKIDPSIASMTTSTVIGDPGSLKNKVSETSNGNSSNTLHQSLLKSPLDNRGSSEQMVKSVTLDEVKLNVGGKVYTVPMDVLTKYPESKLGKWFTGAVTLPRDNKGRYYIDRQGDYFGPMMHYLEYGPAALVGKDRNFRDKVARELTFFEIPKVEQKKNPVKVTEKWKWNPKYAKPNALRISKKCTQVQAREYDKGFILGDKPFTKGVYQWRIKIGNTQENIPYIAMGLANTKNEELFMDGNLRFVYTWGLTTDGEKLVNQEDGLENELWLMEIGDEIGFKFAVEDKKFVITHLKTGETTEFDDVEGEIYPYAYLINPSDFIITTVL